MRVNVRVLEQFSVHLDIPYIEGQQTQILYQKVMSGTEGFAGDLKEQEVYAEKLTGKLFRTIPNNFNVVLNDAWAQETFQQDLNDSPELQRILRETPDWSTAALVAQELLERYAFIGGIPCKESNELVYELINDEITIRPFSEDTAYKSFRFDELPLIQPFIEELFPEKKSISLGSDGRKLLIKLWGEYESRLQCRDARVMNWLEALVRKVLESNVFQCTSEDVYSVMHGLLNENGRSLNFKAPPDEQNIVKIYFSI